MYMYIIDIHIRTSIYTHTYFYTYTIDMYSICILSPYWCRKPSLVQIHTHTLKPAHKHTQTKNPPQLPIACVIDVHSDATV